MTIDKILKGLGINTVSFKTLINIFGVRYYSPKYNEKKEISEIYSYIEVTIPGRFREIFNLIPFKIYIGQVIDGLQNVASSEISIGGLYEAKSGEKFILTSFYELEDETRFVLVKTQEAPDFNYSYREFKRR